MPELAALACAWGAVLALAVLGWLASLARRDVSVVDSLWSLFFLVGALVYSSLLPRPGPRALLVLPLVGAWAARLCLYLTWRNWGQPEDRRYQAIRARNQPGFEWKSLWLVFGFQGALACALSAPLLAALRTGAPAPTLLDVPGVLLWSVGFLFESVADAQLAAFRRRPHSAGQVLDTGLWRYTRHPNYFGEALLWWGYYLIAAAAGAWWTIFAPLTMTLLLLRFSGVALLERDIGERRPAYRDYMARTNAFLPGMPREAA